MSSHAIINVQDDDVVGDDVSAWTPNQVVAWLRESGYQEHEHAVTSGQIDGARLLALTTSDLKAPPFNVTSLHEADHLHTCIETLRKSQLAKYMKKFEKNGIRNGYRHTGTTNHATSNGRVSNGYAHSESLLETGDQYSSIKTPLLGGDESTGNGNHSPNEQYPAEKLKTLVGLLYMMFGFVVSVLMLQVVHDRVPDMTEEPPLRDVFFDIVPRRVEGAFSICETIGMILTVVIAVLSIFHKHRFIIARRIFFILGTLYLYRSCTIYVTTLPVPGLHFKCAPKSHGSISVMLTRAASLLFGGGLTVTGSHHLCGDYLFSGHTIILVVSYLCIHEYTPKRWWWLHWTCWVMAATGIVCILLAHDHYTVDVIVAYLLTTRLFWTYHSMCNIAALKEESNANMLSRAWWFPIFRYLEGNVCASALPRQFEWPLPWPRNLRNSAITGRRSPIKGV
uniref:Phosphatidylcholine:ceramide cholinephosphotransferase 2-like n=1 Tax=Phallusia mammillata TaxID=59560 RepID=A0A6F9DSP9_9ASCI|nr:phosphatidylcholine:ceramide cholinephosphotransferase 2-like [Phallusia mammillata]